MNKWWWLLLITFCWIGAGFAIFGQQEKQNRSTDSLPGQADRIVSMAPNLTEILFALGLEGKIVGVTLHCNYPPAAAGKPKIGTFWQPNIEAVIAAKPTLVVTLGFEQQRSIAERLGRVGLHCLTVNIEKVSELFEAIDKIGTATGKQYEANQLVSGIRKKLNGLASLVSTKDKVRVLWVVQREPLRVAGRDTFVNEMIELAGGENAIGPTIYKYPPIGAEQVIASGADVIIEPSMTEDDLPSQQEKSLQYWNRFENVPAVINRRIYVINGDIVSRLGPRLYEGVETIARCLSAIRPAESFLQIDL
jgi:iron complex transport system substrate-binding protein